MKKIIINFIIVFVIAICDQLTKYYISHNFYIGESVAVIDGLMNFTFVKNSGAAFGFGGNYHDSVRLVLFKILPVIACFWLAYAIVKEAKTNYLQSLAYTLVLGGAIGNLIDRIYLDYVVDFFDFYWNSHHFATFNIADSAISIAAVIIIFEMRKPQVKKKEDAATS